MRRTDVQIDSYREEYDASADNPADLTWPAVVLVILAAPLCIVAEWWRRMRG
ncbi:MAG: hypothetical protein KGL35_24715 [Bradyrhizobium sp.]|nr:hypothetical protein [Bradyrhizobium sp.]